MLIYGSSQRQAAQLYIAGFVFVMLACTTSAALSGQALQKTALEPRVFDDIHNSQYGRFSHWSAVVERKPDRLSIEYAVCNLDDKPLIYMWRGPNISVGDGGTLPRGKCHILRRDVAGVEHNRRATIAFTQAARNHPASAHVSELWIKGAWLPRFLENSLRTFFQPEGMTAQPSLADLSVVQRQSNGVVTHTISWHPPSVAVAFSIDAFAGQDKNVVTRAINKSGYKAEIVKLDALLAESSKKSVDADRLAGEAILITRLPESPDQLVFSLEGNAAAVSQSYVSLLSVDAKRLITGFDISSFGP